MNQPTVPNLFILLQSTDTGNTMRYKKGFVSKAFCEDSIEASWPGNIRRDNSRIEAEFGLTAEGLSGMEEEDQRCNLLDFCSRIKRFLFIKILQERPNPVNKQA